MSTARKIDIIGSTTFVDFPVQGLFGVPAKVDTGADSSSVWASNISEKDGTLQFVLFAENKPWYTGKTIKVSSYQTSIIKNSFGVSEHRYKVPFTINLEGRSIKARLTLADRSKNTYPILIGRRTLQGKFVVDVAKPQNKSTKTKQVETLVLVNKGSQKITDFYIGLNRKNKGKVKTLLYRYSDIICEIDNKNIKMYLADSGKDIADFDLVYFKTLTKNSEFGSLVAAYAQYHSVPFIDKVAIQHQPNSKIVQGTLLAMCGVSVPKTIFMSTELFKEKYDTIVKNLGLPFIFKNNHGRKGRDNYLIKDQKEFEAICKGLDGNDHFIAQKFIKNDGDYRVLVFGSRAPLVIHRQAKDTSAHSHNVAQGANVQLVSKPDNELLRMGIGAADCLKWQIAGVDMMQDKNTGKWYCLEVNNSPQLVSGSFVDLKQKELAKFLYEEAL